MRTSPRIMTAVLCRFTVDQVIVEGGTFNEFYVLHSVRYDANVTVQTDRCALSVKITVMCQYMSTATCVRRHWQIIRVCSVA
jgi:hypothetical protein